MKLFRQWWGDSEPTSFFDYLDRPYIKPHWSAQWVRKCAGFCAREWKWIAGFVIAICGLIIKR